MITEKTQDSHIDVKISPQLAIGEDGWDTSHDFKDYGKQMMMDDKRWWWLGLMVHDEGFSGDEWRWCLVTGLNDDGSKPMDDDEDGNSDDDAECRGRLFIGDLMLDGWR